jgi:SNF2 family DNA or RNA helicase
MNSNQEYQFCFDLSLDKTTQKFHPTVYILPNNKPITYLNKKATAEILENLAVVVSDLPKSLQQLLSICNDLNLANLTKKYNSKNKSPKSIQILLEDKKIKFGFETYFESKLDNFISIVVQNQFPLSINLDFEKDFRKSKIVFHETEIESILHFQKHADGITYTQFQIVNNKRRYPSDLNISILTNQSGWILIDKGLHKLNQINSNKLKPFLTKKTVEIPKQHVKVFFENFIKDNLKKATVEAQGFEIEYQRNFDRCAISFDTNFFKSSFFIQLNFNYNGYVFTSNSFKKKHTEINLQDLENIKVTQFERHDTELEYHQKLIDLGLVKTENGNFVFQESSNSRFQIVEWVIENHKKLKSLGFYLDSLTIDSKKISVDTNQISYSNEIVNDWFDVKIKIQCGRFEIPFTEMVSNIKANNPLYQLPDGSCFLIPEQWLSRFSSLVKNGTVTSTSIKIQKSKQALLDEMPGLNTADLLSDKVTYEPSDLLKAELRPYQIQGVEWLLQHCANNLGACLADDMGLGKTIQTLAMLVQSHQKLDSQVRTVKQMNLFDRIISNNKEPLKALIVLPASLVFNWYNEAKKFTPHFDCIRYVGNDRKIYLKKLSRYDLIFTTYHTISNDINLLEKQDFRFLILDESQWIKNKNSKVFESINKITSTHRISLSGTPIENSLDDLWSQMEFLNPNMLGDYAFFIKNYKIPIEKHRDENALQELKTLISPFILRRSKENVLYELPDLTEQHYYCDMQPEQEKWYEEEKSKARNLILEGENTDRQKMIQTLMRLRQLSNHPQMVDAKSNLDSGKFIAVTEYLTNLVKSGQKTIVFSSFISNLEFYKQWCVVQKIEFCELNGSHTNQEREAAVNQFQNQEKIKVFLMSLKAGGVGLNITKASYVLFLDPWWNPFIEKQGIARAHRMGQENPVHVVRFISKNTVEEKIIQLQETKKILVDALIDEDFLHQDLSTNLEFILS